MSWRLPNLPLRSHFNSQGKPKKAYATKDEARVAASRYGGNPYLCDFCKKFHTGNRKGKR
jgi:hypothetical protein